MRSKTLTDIKFDCGEKGFTLIELLTTLSVISILSAVAVRQFQTYQSRAFDVRAEHDLHQLITAEEAYFSQFDLYASCSNRDCETVLVAFSLSDGVRLTVSTEDGGESFQGEAFHPRGDKTHRFDSASRKYTSEHS